MVSPGRNEVQPVVKEYSLQVTGNATKPVDHIYGLQVLAQLGQQTRSSPQVTL